MICEWFSFVSRPLNRTEPSLLVASHQEKEKKNKSWKKGERAKAIVELREGKMKM